MKPYFSTDYCRLFLADCLPAMREMPDRAFDLAVVDPPYGLDSKLVCGGTWASNRKREYSGWDKKPTQEYFNELFRTSKNQFIFGGNYFSLPASQGFVIWDKPSMRIQTMADCEYIWTSFQTPAKIVKENQEKGVIRISLSQKPVALYRWLLTNYAKPGQTILDTHLGSGSIAIACHDLGFHLTAFEIDQEYLDGAVERIKRYLRQPKLFKPVQEQPTQESFL